MKVLGVFDNWKQGLVTMEKLTLDLIIENESITTSLTLETLVVTKNMS